jgi:hypothetical protein
VVEKYQLPKMNYFFKVLLWLENATKLIISHEK